MPIDMLGGATVDSLVSSSSTHLMRRLFLVIVGRSSSGMATPTYRASCATCLPERPARLAHFRVSGPMSVDLARSENAG